MTNEEALEYWEGIRCGFYDDARKHPTFMERSGKTLKLNMILAINEAIEAIEKQVPKPTKPMRVGTVDYPTCPICGRVIWKEEQYCATCGQKLDRSEE